MGINISHRVYRQDMKIPTPCHHVDWAGALRSIVAVSTAYRALAGRCDDAGLLRPREFSMRKIPTQNCASQRTPSIPSNRAP